MLQKEQQYEQLRKFYDGEYYGANAAVKPLSWHYKAVARRLGDPQGKQVLDIACGTGDWLAYFEERGGQISGIDISERAVEVCNSRFDKGEFVVGPAEELPFDDSHFDLITCMGSLEHFVDPDAALQEMRRVAKPDAKFLILVPNAGFLPRRLGLYAGTQQVKVREVVRSLEEWQELLQRSGLSVVERWRDLHVMTMGWICSEGWLRAPLRAAQAVALSIWPMRWQYQVYHLCVLSQPC
jgi:SAM-dependent methyltransferase